MWYDLHLSIFYVQTKWRESVRKISWPIWPVAHWKVGRFQSVGALFWSAAVSYRGGGPWGARGAGHHAGSGQHGHGYAGQVLDLHLWGDVLLRQLRGNHRHVQDHLYDDVPLLCGGLPGTETHQCIPNINVCGRTHGQTLGVTRSVLRLHCCQIYKHFKINSTHFYDIQTHLILMEYFGSWQNKMKLNKVLSAQITRPKMFLFCFFCL